MKKTLALCSAIACWIATSIASAKDVAATSCSSEHVRAAIEQVQAAGGGEVSIPQGRCTWNETLDLAGNVDIIGAGMEQTVITDGALSYNGGDSKTDFARISGIHFVRTSPDFVIKFLRTYNFRVDHCTFEGKTQIASPITMKSGTKGLIDHCTFINPNDPVAGSYYGVNTGMPYSDPPPKDVCDDDVCSCWIGNPDAVPKSARVEAGHTVISSDPAVIDNAGGAGKGTVRRIYLEIASVGTNPSVTLAIFRRESGNTFTAVGSQTHLAVARGKNIFTVEDNEFTPFAVQDGDYLGAYLDDCTLAHASGTTDWSSSGDHTNETGADFGPPNIGKASFGAEIFDQEGAYGACEAQWDDWYDNERQARPAYSGFREDFTPYTDEAIYIEDCTFDWYKAAVEGNWGNSFAFVLRHNSFKSDTGQVMVGFKPGTIFALVHDNVFDNTDGGQAGYALRLRSSGLVYNNTFKNLSTGFYLNGMRSYSFYYPPQVRMDELYVWGNTFDNCKCGASERDCFGGIDGGGDYSLVGEGENGNVHLRAPRSGERLYGFREYPYPHPLSSGEPAPPLPDASTTDGSSGDAVAPDRSMADDSGPSDVNPNLQSDESGCACGVDSGDSPSFPAFTLLLGLSALLLAARRRRW